MIRIGADEIILWLRKNGKATNVPNDQIHGLGIKIDKTIEALGGNKIENEGSVECFWANKDGDKNIGQFLLPKNATQYFIDENRLPELYRELSLW